MWLFGAVGTRNPVGPVATVFPEFIARDGQERADGGRQGDKRRVGAARRRSRGHGPARLDGTRARATVADKVMKSGETAGQGNGPPLALVAQQAKRAGPGQVSGPKASAERSEGTMEARRGRDSCSEARCAARQRDRPFPGRGRPDCRRYLKASRSTKARVPTSPPWLNTLQGVFNIRDGA